MNDMLCNKGDVPLRVVGLKPSTKYLLSVRAVNDVGPGTPVIRTEITENIRTCRVLLYVQFVSALIAFS